MIFEQLINIINEGYPEELIWQYYKEPDVNHGDGLAKFVVAEVSDTFNECASDKDQIKMAIQVLGNAQNELDAVITSLENSEELR